MLHLVAITTLTQLLHLVAITTLTQPSTLRSTATPGLIAMVTLVAYLIAREVAGTSVEERAVRWRRGLMVVIIPLLMVFAVIVAEKVAHALG